MKFEIGDWVQGKTVDGEFIHGYIETADAQREIVRVRVVQSDHEEAVGKTVSVRGSWLKLLPVNSLEDPDNLESLVDLALSTMDEVWFQELTDRMKQLRSDKGKETREIPFRGKLSNRWGLSGKKS
ncbi:MULTISPECIES: hypothetical protein [Paenibacillus]|uniref:IDEAL domain-containing protein n=2 Tax=Paenibacillus TaxID=44249 RepID=A0A920CDY8_9BACL|nr:MULTISPECIES: hypothetical protein [Paenibacillus]GIO33354.1 hypothetical protein J2TS6_44950 [Paenibacillus albilobatus]